MFSITSKIKLPMYGNMTYCTEEWIREYIEYMDKYTDSHMRICPGEFKDASDFYAIMSETFDDDSIEYLKGLATICPSRDRSIIIFIMWMASLMFYAIMMRYLYRSVFVKKDRGVLNLVIFNVLISPIIREEYIRFFLVLLFEIFLQNRVEDKTPPEVNKKEETSLAGFIKTVEENPKMVSHIPDAKDQMEALKKWEKGEMSYAQMRIMCG